MNIILILFLLVIIVLLIVILYYVFNKNNKINMKTFDSLLPDIFGNKERENEIEQINLVNKNLIYKDINTLLLPPETNEEDNISNSLSGKPIIPLNIFQTWHSKKLPDKMKKCVNSLKLQNPEFKYYLFDDNDCREFIKTHYNECVLKTFDKLKPGAFKADLWRCCVLYTFGGIYLDIKFCCNNNFKLIDLTDDEYFVRDYGDDWAVYNAFIITKPKNHIMLSCIKQIVQNVEMNYYGTSPLDVTGPKMMIKFFTPKEKQKLNRISLKATSNGLYIVYGDDHVIMKNYPEYNLERKKNQINEHYSVLWNQKDIYN